MKKTLNINNIQNELSGNSLYFKKAAEESNDKIKLEKEKSMTVDSDSIPIVDQSTDRPTVLPISHLTDQPVTRPASIPTTSHGQKYDSSPVLGRPKSFYITERQDEEIDILVGKLAQRLKGKINHKIDRSIVIRLLLETSEITGDKLVDRLSSQLVSRLRSQLSD